MDIAKEVIQLERQAYGIQGAIEDTEKPQESGVPESAAMDAVLQRFAAVLGKSETSRPLEIIEEVKVGAS